MAQMRLEIDTAGSDLESVARVVLHNCVITIRAAQTTLNGGLVSIGARRGSLCKPQRDQQGRYNHQQECSLHGILRRFSPCGGLEFRLGFDSASDSDVEPPWLSGSGLRTWSVQVKPYHPSSVRIWLSVPNRSHLRRDEFATLPVKSMKAVELVVAQKIVVEKSRLHSVPERVPLP